MLKFNKPNTKASLVMTSWELWLSPWEVQFKTKHIKKVLQTSVILLERLLKFAYEKYSTKENRAAIN